MKQLNCIKICQKKSIKVNDLSGGQYLLTKIEGLKLQC